MADAIAVAVAAEIPVNGLGPSRSEVLLGDGLRAGTFFCFSNTFFVSPWKTFR